MLRKILSLVLSFTLFFSQAGIAAVAPELNIAAYLGKFNYSPPDKLRLPLLRYFSYDNLNNNFKLILDKGDFKEIKGPELKDSSRKLLSYFLIGITLPNESFWVNLRPDSSDNIIDDYLAQTDVGKILLEADLQLKKDTAAFTSPQTPEGKLYWDKLYQKAGELFGSENITIPTLTRPWIVPGEVIIRESPDSAYIYKASLKVMLEQDHLKDSATYNFTDPRLKALNEYSSQLIREFILPKLTKEVNISKRYAQLRQVYYSLVLSRWFKARFYGKGGIYAYAIDKKNLNGLLSQGNWSKNAYFKEYQKSFQQGEYNLKTQVAGIGGQNIRSYFSGGFDATKLTITTTAASPITGLRGNTNLEGVLSRIGIPYSGRANLDTLFPESLVSGEVTSSPAVKGQPSEDNPLSSYTDIQLIGNFRETIADTQHELDTVRQQQIYGEMLKRAAGRGETAKTLTVTSAGTDYTETQLVGQLDRTLQTDTGVRIDESGFIRAQQQAILNALEQLATKRETTASSPVAAEINALFPSALRGDLKAYERFKQLVTTRTQEVKDYFEAQVPQAVAALPVGIFGMGSGYDIRGNTLEVKGGEVDFTPINCYVIGKALGTFFAKEGQSVTITGDQRWHTPTLRLALALGFLSVGVNAGFSEEIFGTGEHGIISGSNPFHDVLVLQLSGSHGVPEKNGLKIKYNVGDHGYGQFRLEPLYYANLEKLGQQVKGGQFREPKKLGTLTERDTLLEFVVRAYDRTLPEIDPQQPIVFDCRNSANIPALKELVKRRGMQQVRWLNDTPLPTMPDDGYPWDPSKPQALKASKKAVGEWNVELEAAGSSYRAIAFIFDGDGDRTGIILEDGTVVSALDAPLFYYERMMVDPVNQQVIDKFKKAGVDPITMWLALDIRSNSRLKKLIAQHPDFLGVWIQLGYPPQREYVTWVTGILDKFVQRTPALNGDADFLKGFRHLKETYFTAEASGHIFSHNVPMYLEKVIDSGIAAAFNLAYIKQTIPQFEARDQNLGLSPGKDSYSLAELFRAFPQAFYTDDIRIIVPNAIKFQLTQRMAARLQEKYKGEISPLGTTLRPLLKKLVEAGILKESDVRYEDNGVIVINMGVTDVGIQDADDGAIVLDGLKLQLKSGGSILFRTSNTGEQCTLIFEGSNSLEHLLQLMAEVEALIREEVAKFEASDDTRAAANKVDLSDFINRRNEAIEKYSAASSPAEVKIDNLKMKWKTDYTQDVRYILLTRARKIESSLLAKALGCIQEIVKTSAKLIDERTARLDVEMNLGKKQNYLGYITVKLRGNAISGTIWCLSDEDATVIDIADIDATAERFILPSANKGESERISILLQKETIQPSRLNAINQLSWPISLESLLALSNILQSDADAKIQVAIASKIYFEGAVWQEPAILNVVINTLISLLKNKKPGVALAVLRTLLRIMNDYIAKPPSIQKEVTSRLMDVQPETVNGIFSQDTKLQEESVKALGNLGYFRKVAYAVQTQTGSSPATATWLSSDMPFNQTRDLIAGYVKSVVSYDAQANNSILGYIAANLDKPELPLFVKEILSIVLAEGINSHNAYEVAHFLTTRIVGIRGTPETIEVDYWSALRRDNVWGQWSDGRVQDYLAQNVIEHAKRLVTAAASPAQPGTAASPAKFEFSMEQLTGQQIFDIKLYDRFYGESLTTPEARGRYKGKLLDAIRETLNTYPIRKDVLVDGWTERSIVGILGHDLLADYNIRDNTLSVTIRKQGDGNLKLMMIQIGEVIFRQSSIDKGRRGSFPLGGIDGSTSSPSIPQNARVGGIDFRSIPLLVQPIGNFSNLKFDNLPNTLTLQKIDLDEEFKQISSMLEKGILPSSQRVKEFILACCYKKELSSRISDLIPLLTSLCRLQEECVCEAEPELKESLMLVEAVSASAAAEASETYEE